MDAYTSFAEVYDMFMDNIPYEDWRVPDFSFKGIWDQ